MLIPRQIFFNRRRLVPLAAAAALVLAFIFWLGRLFSGTAQADQEKIFITALDNTLASRSFRFAVETKLLGEHEFYSKLEGERVLPDKVHIKGTVLQTPVEFTQVQDNTYMKDPFSGKWLMLKDIKMSQTELFFAELNPLAYFNFKDIPQLVLQGEEKAAGYKCLVFELKPNLENIFLEDQFNDYTYQVWVDKQDLVIRQALIRANRADTGSRGLEMSIKLWDYNRQLQVEVPEEIRPN
ncbi:hypothetical protein [Desulforamulus hydrothermalis]|uniref:Outer membrane lipoprotein-sorting protein n=1 Tax=Desulforamulus hydrothermalis Lam5 = DSM 18033 TaxID=1121428 RepID=K8E0V3_9FIRM|nr:hypothetical protein [Desulforamulus hydrothermalis]CCO09195.1 conserved exported hypothetical protein [Desulforamulus hydrothermalis Lam5 = DSM 18033]SHH10904.1 hypothetical protein SAMN02745177_01456 [Desulforamulus hydrothermalis Lam5 = DSM 18033]